MTPYGHALTALVLRREARYADGFEHDRLLQLAAIAMDAAGPLAIDDAWDYIFLSHCGPVELPLRRTEAA